MNLLKTLKVFLMVGTILTTNVHAEDVVILQKDSPAPFTGLLFTQQKANELKNGLVERDGLLKINESLNKSLTLQDNIIQKKDEGITTLLDQNDRLAKSLYNERTVSDWTRAGYFILGVIITGAAFYGAQRITNGN